MTAVPKQRRLPSLALGACAAAMPLLLYGVPLVLFQGLYRGRRPPTPVQYWTYAATFACQFFAYGCGIFCLRLLRTSCPRPATLFGAVFTGIAGGVFIVFGAAWCGFCAFFWFVMTFFPW
jgi:hypothetical protein